MSEHPNCQAIEAFLVALGDKISRPICATERIGGETVQDGYTASYFDQAKGIGFTVIAWGDGYFKVHVEMAGKIERAVSDGKLVTRLFD